ncbi:MAG: hypothetical protein ABII64_04440 [Elusimicrobiota bacterium]
MKEKLTKLFSNFKDYFSDKEDVNEPGYDPVHIGGMIVLVLFGMTVLFWLLWALLVFGGGIQAKIMPFIELVFTPKTAADFGYVGYPYEMGVFEGWPTNLVALVFTVSIIIAIWFVFKQDSNANTKHKILNTK